MFDIEQINLLMRSRRSVFPDQFVAGKAIPDEIIHQLLENANRAPTHKLTQPWRFTIFSGKGLLKLAQFQAERYQLTAGEKFKQDKYEKFLRTSPLCSHVIAIGMKRNPIIPEIEEMASVACAVENLWLSVTAYGLGGYWSTGGVTFDSEAKSFFGLDENDKLMGFFYLGYVEVASPKSSRTPIEEKLVWIRE